MSYTQNNEERYITSYFKDFTGTLLDLGANDGKTFSNSLKLIEKGWKATLVEASPTIFTKLRNLHKDNKKVQCVNVAVGNENKNLTFYESGNLIGKEDYSLVSTIDKEELKRWPDIKFKKMEVTCFDYKNMLTFSKIKSFDFISIDIEGLDYDVLSQIDLSKTKMLVVEFNGKEEHKYINYCKGFGMRELHRNGENLIFVR